MTEMSDTLDRCMAALEKVRDAAADMALTMIATSRAFKVGCVAALYGYPAILMDRRKARRIARFTGVRFSVRLHRGRRVYVWPRGVEARRLDPPAGLRAWRTA